jgi:hypothetical protein
MSVLAILFLLPQLMALILIFPQAEKIFVSTAFLPSYYFAWVMGYHPHHGCEKILRRSQNIWSKQ